MTPTGLLDQLATLHDLASRLDAAAEMTLEHPHLAEDLPLLVLNLTAKQRKALYSLAQHLRKIGVGAPPETSSSSEDET